MSWRDDFDDESLDSSKFGTSVAGDGAVAESGGTVNITMGANAANAALVYIKDAIVSNADYCYRLRHKIDGTPSALSFYFGVVEGTPACANNADFYTSSRIGLRYNSTGDALLIFYKNTAGTYYYWTGSAWSTTATNAFTNLQKASWVDIAFIVNNAKWRFCVTIRGDTLAVIETAPIAFTALYAYTTLYGFWGEPVTDYNYVTSMKTDFVIYSNETKEWAFYNGSITGSVYSIGRCASFDGGDRFYRDPVTALVSAAAGENTVKNPVPVNLGGGTQYLIYGARRTDTQKWRTRCKSSTDYFETSTDHSYIVQEGGVGSWNEKGTIILSIAYDSGNSLYIGYALGIDADDEGTIGVFTTDDLTAAWDEYESNPIITLPTWADTMITPQDVLSENDTLKLWINGYDSGDQRWYLGLYTSTTGFYTFNADAGNPIDSPPTANTTHLDVATVAGDTQLTVDSSAKFSAEDPIVIESGGGSAHETNRVLSVPDGTHLNLYYPVALIHAIDKKVAVVDYGDPGMPTIEASNAYITLIHIVGSSSFLEVSAYFDRSGDTGFVIDSVKSPVLAIGPSWDTNSAENIKTFFDPSPFNPTGGNPYYVYAQQ